MKKVKKLYVLCLIALTFIVCAIIFGTVNGKNSVSASAYTSYGNNYIAGYDAVYDIRADRSMTVKETLTFHFDGRSGFVREIPVNGGESVRNIRVKELDGSGAETDVYYKVTAEKDEDGNDFVWVDMGSSATKTGNYTFRLTYDYIVPASKYEAQKNIIALAPVGSGYGFHIENINLKFILPDGYVKDNTVCYIDNIAKTEVDLTETAENGKTVFTAHIDYLANYTGVRFDAGFSGGVLKTNFDFTPYIFVILAAALLGVLLIVRVLCFGKDRLTPVVNFEAPNNMNPLLMGKLIDTRINSEDITSMIFYFADKGYLKINFDDKNNPTLIRIVQQLPQTATDYEKIMFDGLFASGEVVTPAQLENKFYKTVEKVTSRVNASAKGFFTSKSMLIAVMFAIIGGLLLGLAPFILALAQISTSYFVIAPFLAVIPVLVIFGASQTVKWYSLKLSKNKKTAFYIAIAVACLIISAIYAFFVPHWIMGFIPKFLLCAICCAVAAVSVSVISRSENYIKQLNEIVGFKNFILLAEKDRLEAMLEDDPQFYYHVLPYAQVLGVSDIWEEKFEDITVQPPQWYTSSALDTVFRFHVFNSIMRNSMATMTRNMVSRPSSGASGGHSGHFGGFSGGGHGGGGGHFR